MNAQEWSPLAGVPEDVRARAARVRLACFDIDGVMTDGGLHYSDQGHEAKRFNVQDGLGLKLLADCGVTIAIITGRDTPAVLHRARDLGIARVHAGERDKLARVRSIAGELGLDLDSVAFCGDDLPDLGAMQHVGFAVAVANAHPSLRAATHRQTTQPGGAGALRELCDLIMAARGRLGEAIARFSR